VTCAVHLTLQVSGLVLEDPRQIRFMVDVAQFGGCSCAG
jgi:hypothetical protein